jgi:hypothetical protein
MGVDKKGLCWPSKTQSSWVGHPQPRISPPLPWRLLIGMEMPLGERWGGSCLWVRGGGSCLGEDSALAMVAAGALSFSDELNLRWV